MLRDKYDFPTVNCRVFAVFSVFFLFACTLTSQVVDSMPVFASQNFDSVNGKQVYYIVEKMPRFPGGESALREYIATNLVFSKDSGSHFHTRAYVSFIINDDGHVSNVHIEKPMHSEGYTLMEKSLIELLESMPAWKPGVHFGEKVSVRYTVPINVSYQ